MTDSSIYTVQVDPTIASDKYYYALTMFPYPSGSGLHVGHASIFTINDIVARFKRMQGYKVLNPFGFDSFGLPTENYAMKQGKPAYEVTKENWESFIKQISALNLSFDMSRVLYTSDPEYYKWTQWIFWKLFEQGLVYRDELWVNRCPNCQTVLANDQVVDGKCERCSTEIMQKKMPQWFIKITAYADRLIKDLDLVDWPEETKIAQRNWIGRSEGAEIQFEVAGNEAAWWEQKLAKEYCSLSFYDQHTWVTLKNGTKTIETRALNPHEPERYFGNIVEGDVLRFVNKLTGEIMYVRVKETFKRKNLEELFHDKENMLAVASNKEHAKWIMTVEEYKQWRAYTSNYIEQLELHGIFGFAFDIVQVTQSLTVFTTRPDTLYGVTAVVLAPENTTLDAYIPASHKSNVDAYRSETAKKTAVERQQNEKEKTGVFAGMYLAHPFTGENVPVWFADYVLPDYATGAVMFVPAHDERDFEFAQKQDLRIKVVIEGPESSDAEEDIDEAYTCYTWWWTLINSWPFDGLESREAKKEITDHLIMMGRGARKVNYKLRDRSVSRQRYRGSPIPIYYDIKENPLVPFFKYTTGHRGFKEGEPTITRRVIQAVVKDKNSDQYCFLQWAHDGDYSGFFGGIEGDESPVDAAMRELREEGGFEKATFVKEITYYQIQFYHPTKNRNQYSLNTSLYFEVDRADQKNVSEEESKQHTTVRMTAEEFLAKSKNDTTIFVMNMLLGREYMKDGWTMTEKYNEFNPAPEELLVPKLIPEDELPVVLPLDVQNYTPKWKSPLEDHAEFPHYKAKDGKTYRRECDTLDTFMCSSFYFLRFPDAHNPHELISKEYAERFLPVDFYSWGKEHTVGHLLYARFINKFLYDQWYITNPEPFMKLVHQGMVLAHDGRKMWKRYGNVIDPLDVIAKYSSDSLRTYLMFMGPVEADKNRNDNALQGVHRFLERVKRLPEFFKDDVHPDVDALLHKTIKGVTEDLQKYKFNTAVSKLMILVNKVYEVQQITKWQLKIIAQLLSPFATELAEETWLSLWGEQSVHISTWPTRDESKMLETTVTLPVQINGKKKFEVEVATWLTEAEAMDVVKASPSYERLIGTAPIQKVIYVQDKIMNIIL